MVTMLGIDSVIGEGAASEAMSAGASAFAHAVHAVVAGVPPGQVVTYGEVAVEVGRPGAARAVGRLMAGSEGTLPWWRVVAADGRLVPGHEAEHRRRLRAEGVDVGDRRVRGMRRR